MTRLKPRTATVVIYQGDDMDLLAEAKREADQETAEQAGPSGRLGDGVDPDAELAPGPKRQAYLDLLDEVADRALTVTLHDLGHRRWRDLVMAHPPRMVPEEVAMERRLGETEHQTVPTGKMVEHDDDVRHSVNTETFPRALLLYADGQRATMNVDPPFDNEEDRQAFVDDELPEGDFERLWLTAFELNVARGRDPKALMLSTAQR